MDKRIGGHSNTVNINNLSVDTGFIVYNVKNYPNLIALLLQEDRHRLSVFLLTKEALSIREETR